VLKALFLKKALNGRLRTFHTTVFALLSTCSHFGCIFSRFRVIGFRTFSDFPQFGALNPRTDLENRETNLYQTTMKQPFRTYIMPNHLRRTSLCCDFEKLRRFGMVVIESGLGPTKTAQNSSKFCSFLPLVKFRGQICQMSK